MDTNSIIQQVIKQIEDCDNEKTTQNITAQKRTFYSTNELLAKQYTKRSKELPLLSNYNNNAESMRAGLWRIMDANNAKDFENFGPTKYVINLRALSNAHFANVDSKRMTSFNGILSTRNRNYMNYENSVLPSFAENTPCDRIIKMLEKSVKDVSSKDGYSNNFTSEPVIKNPVVRAMIKKAKVANSVPTILGKIDVVDLEGRRENQENDDQRAFSNLLKMCGLRHINHYDFNPRRSEVMYFVSKEQCLS
ncbi:hypothetical protein GJ496_010628 [Pomphorhynchus laevis]|nr:hypothetical protein GJ496_010628 [Pomphorhynchus laevis]